jgi:GTP cyclohydrolase I
VRGTRSHRQVAAAFRGLLESLDAPVAGELRQTPERAAALWLDHLTSGEGINLAAVLGRGSPSASASPVSLFGIGIHLVCPHHLTIAFGQAHVAYIPNGRLAGFGALARLVGAASARLALQEEVTDAIADALICGLGARAAVVVLEATHPCHNVLHPRSQRARAVTWAVRGEKSAARRLEQDLRRALAAAAGKGR